MIESIQPDLPDQPAGLERFGRAILNILEDAAGERTRLVDTQSAILNVLEDAAAQQASLLSSQSAVLNVLEDAAGETAQIQATQKAILNILHDSAAEQDRLADAQRAILNVLEDFDAKNIEIEQVNQQMVAEIAVRRRTEESLSATNKELEAFSYSVSHDLRAPLRSIDGFSLALMEDYADKLDGEGKDYLRRIRGATQRMALLIDESLKLARISRSELTYEVLDLSAMAKSILAGLQEADPTRQVECAVPDGITALGDTRSLQMVLENLLSNAWKYTSKKEHARIEFGASWQDGQRVYFVRDDGAGFDMAYAQRLFGVFQRLHTETEFPGVGVGLAIVQRIVLRHGGHVSAEGAVGMGATFSFTLHDERSLE